MLYFHKVKNIKLKAILKEEDATVIIDFSYPIIELNDCDY
jgi:hypothetical protein